MPMMKVFEFVEVVARFHQYVMRGNTGDASSFAEKLGICRASLYNLLDELKSYGIEIIYNRERQSYLYLHSERVEIKVSIGQYTEEELEKRRTNAYLSTDLDKLSR